MKPITFVCRGMGEGGGIQRVINEISAELISNNLVEDLVIISDNFSDEHNIEGITYKKLWSPSQIGIARKMPRYFYVLMCQPVFIILATLYIFFNRKKLGIVHNHGVGQCLIQDVVVFHSCHHEWVKLKIKKKGIKYYINPLDWVILLCEKINTLNQRLNRLQIVSVSDMTKDQVINHLNVREVKVIPNGVNISRFKPFEEKYNLRETLGFKKTDKIILFVANEWKRKGLLEVIESVQKLQGTLDNIKLLVVGRNLKTAVEELTEKFGLKESVLYFGEVKEIEKLYQIADVFCVPSKEDAFGLVFAEAMACQLPTITTDRCGIKSYINNGVNGYILDSNRITIQLTNILEKLLQDEALRNKIGYSARETVIESMSWKSIASRYALII